MTEGVKPSFILYKKYYEILDDLQDEEMGLIFRAILKYQATGELLDLPAGLKIAFGFIKNQFDVDEKKYNEFIEKQSENGKKGGRPKIKQETQENPKNPSLFLKTQKSLKEKEKENENENENEKVSLSHISEREGVGVNREGVVVNREGVVVNVCEVNPSEIKTETEGKERETLSSREAINAEDRELLEEYVRKNMREVKNVKAYVRKLIENGDFKNILKLTRKKRKKRTREEIISEERTSVHDKRSAARVLYRYYLRGTSPPDEFEDIMVKYGLDTYDKLYAYSIELDNEHKAEAENTQGTTSAKIQFRATEQFE